MDGNFGKINFKPLHSGVGFHPFSDGLPYAPQGLTALRRQKSLKSRPQTIVQATAVKPKPVQQENPVSLKRRRFFAYLLDMHLHLGFWLFMVCVFNLVFGFKIDLNLAFNQASRFIPFFLFSQWIFVGLQEFLFETTFGKNFFGLEFIKNHRSYFPLVLMIRSLVFTISVLFFGLGWIYSPQDRLAELQVRKQA